MKKLLSVLLILVMIFTFAACGSDEPADDGAQTGGDEAVTLVVGAASTGDTNPYTKAIVWAQEYLAEKGSTVSLDYKNGSVLGSETELCQNVALGTVDIAQTADMSTTGLMPKMAFSNFPGMFKGYDDVYAAWGADGWAFKLCDQIMNEAGMKLLAAGDNGFRIISNSKHPITSIEDIKGLKIRVPENQLLLAIWDKFGAQTAPIALGDLTAALQQGVVDGQELGVQHFYSFGWVDFNKYLTQLNYNYSACLMYINQDKFNSLSETQQADLMAAFEYGSTKMIEYVAEFEANALVEMKGEGLEALEATPEMQEQFYKIGYELAHEDTWFNLLGEELVNTMYPTAP